MFKYLLMVNCKKFKESTVGTLRGNKKNYKFS